jgi:hypothetical protein
MAAARRLVKGDAGSPINEEALAAFGLVHVGEVEDRRIPVWPENVKTVEVFSAMGTQWNVAGKGGVVGLRYESLAVVMRLCAVPAAEREQVFHGLRHMERAALEDLNRGR